MISGKSGNIMDMMKTARALLQVASSIVARLTVVAFIVAPLVVGSMWIYHDSSRTFRFQRIVRDAQTARENIGKQFLEMEDSVRGFSVTRDPKFLSRYQQSRSTISTSIDALAGDLRALHLNGDNGVSMAERSTIYEWEHEVAYPIIIDRRHNFMRAFRSSDEALDSQVLDDDKRLGKLLNDATSVADERRQRLLHTILVASCIVVTIVAAIVLTLLETRALASRTVLEHTLLYEQEKRIAMRLQQELIPERLPIVSGLALHSIYVPASSERHVGGDWYDVVELRDNRILFMIGDVAGHGLDAALIMNRVRQQIISAAFSEDDPAMILKRANAAVIANISRIVTAACCILDLGTRRMIYGTAGHPAPIIVPATGPAFVLPSGAPPLGAVDDLEIVSVEHTLDAGSMMLLYTDGLFEESMDVLLGQRILLQAVENQRDARDPAAAVYGAVFAHGQQPRDDVAILSVRMQSTA